MTGSATHVWRALAVGMALAGVALAVFRPVAPAVGDVATPLSSFDPELLTAVADYQAERRVAGAAALLVTVVVPASFLLWRPVRARLDGMFPRRGTVLRGAAVASVVAVATTAVTFPLAVWSGFVHERAWGFRTASFATWLRDHLVADGLLVLAAVVLATVFVWVRRRWPGSWHWRLTVAGTALTALLVLGYPVLVQPLLLSTHPLGTGTTREAVEEVLERAGEPGLEILVGDASRRTTKVNAFVTGLGPSRQVVLFDTLLELPPEQVAVVVAHELAHRENADIVRGVLLSASGLLIGTSVLRWWLGGTGRPSRVEVTEVVRPVVALLLLLALGQVVAAPVANAISRRAEAAADHRALELTGAAGRYVATQRTFVARDLADPTPPWWVMALWGTHPSPEHRIEAAVAFAHEHELRLPSLDELRDEEPRLPTVPRG